MLPFLEISAVAFGGRDQAYPRYIPKITSLQYLCNISRKRRGINMIFFFFFSIKVFYKLVVSLLLVIAKNAQNTQKSKLVISLQYLKKEGRDEVDFLYADKYQTIILVDIINFNGHDQASLYYPK